MKQSLQLGISITVILVVLVFINLQPQKKQISWLPTFSHTDKNPFGTYVLFNELEQWIPKKDIQLLPNSLLYNELGLDLDSTALFTDSTSVNLILIRPTFNPHLYEKEKLLQFIDQGNTVFISSSTFPHDIFNLIDSSLSLKYNFSSEDHVHIKTAKENALIYMKGEFECSFFDSLNTYPSYSVIQHDSTQFYSNFIKIPYGKGELILHNFPYALSNYYVLNQAKAYQVYATDIINTLPKQKTYWVTPSSGSTRKKTRDLLSVIRQIPSLFSAWKLLLTSLLLYVVFKAKREQRSIPIIPELKNDSKAYIKVISNLYYEEQDYLNLTHKKMLVLFDQLKMRFYIDITPNIDPQLICNKTQSSHRDVSRLLTLINQYQQQKTFTKKEFLEFCKLSDHILKS